VVEVSVTVALEQFGLAAAPALAATLVYRAFTLWVPFFFGAVLEALRILAELTRRARKHSR
jgi:uncharacterized membrane protein YbhN (UPF0104 family)